MKVRPSQTSDETLFNLFSEVLSEPGTADIVCRELLSELIGLDVKVHWQDLNSMDPEYKLAEAVASAASGSELKLESPRLSEDNSDREFREWWAALLARYGLYGFGSSICADEFGELIVTTFRMLRDRNASDEYIRNLGTVHCGAVRLKDRYMEFRFASRGRFAKSYKCQSRLSSEEYVCHQIRKDRVGAPPDHMRSELEILRNVDHPHFPRVVEGFEDFNSLYVVTEASDGMELVAYLQDQNDSGKHILESWVAEVMRQVIEALRHLHELRPHSIVHGDLRLSSIHLAFGSNSEVPPHVLLTDLGLAGLPPSPPPRAHRKIQPSTLNRPGVSGTPGMRAVSRGCSPVCPKLDIWCCGSLLFVLLSGQHPHGCRDLAASLQLEDAETSPPVDWAALKEASHSSRSLCAEMLARDPRARPDAGGCLLHPWLSDPARIPAQHVVAKGALERLVQSYRRSQLRQVVTEHILTNLSDSPFTCISAAQDVLQTCTGGSDVPAALTALGISEEAVKCVVQAFGSDHDSASDYMELATCCAELAEDLLDHALWRVFMAAGEDHRGIVAVAELERALLEDGGKRALASARQPAGSSVSATAGGDLAGGVEPSRQSNDPGFGDIVRQIANGRLEISFEDLKAAIIQSQSSAGLVPLAGGHGGQADAGSR